MELTGKNIIGAQLSQETGNSFFGQNPATGNKLEPAFFEASQEEINIAIEKAGVAFQKYRKKRVLKKQVFWKPLPMKYWHWIHY